MSQDTIRTTIGRTYAVLVTQAPCTLYYQDEENAEKLTVLTAEEPGTYAFVAFGTLLKKETGSCRIVESFNYAPLGSPAKGGVKEFYITVDDDGTRRTHNNSKLVCGDFIFSMTADFGCGFVFDSNPFSRLASGIDMFYRCHITSWTVPLPALVRGGGMFYLCPITSWTIPLPSLENSINMFYSCLITSWTVPLPALTHGERMFHQGKVASWTAPLPVMENGSHMFYNCSITSWTVPLPALVNGYNMFVNNPITSWTVPLPKLEFAPGMFNGCKLSKPSVLIIINSLQAFGEKGMIDIGAAKACQGDLDIAAAITAAQARGWTIQISYKA